MMIFFLDVVELFLSSGVWVFYWYYLYGCFVCGFEDLVYYCCVFFCFMLGEFISYECCCGCGMVICNLCFLDFVCFDCYEYEEFCF